MNGWDVALLAIAIYVAVVTLARMMISRRDALWEELRLEAQAEQRQQKEQQRKQAATEEDELSTAPTRR